MTETTASQAPISLKATPRRPALLAGFDNTIDLLVQVQGPDALPSGHRRSALSLALVLDRSGSMGGQPLSEALRCARRMIERLNPEDRAALVAYDDQIDTLVSSRPLQDKAPFLAALQGVPARGWTDLHGGWLQGAQEVAAHTRPEVLSRVLLLSDGQANRGVTDPDAIASQCAELAAAGVTTSTYGLGRDFNEDLMDRMAQEGQGKAYYGETADDLMEPFQREFDLLEALCAKRLRLRAEPSDGIQAAVLNLYATEADASVLPDLACGSEAWAVVRLKVPAAYAGRGDGAVHPLLRISLAAQGLDGQPLALPPLRLELPSLPPQAFHAVSEDELVARRVGEVEAAGIQERAQRAARREDWPEVRRLLQEARSRAKDNPWVQAIVDTLEGIAQREDTERFAKEARYSSRSLSSRIAALDEIAAAPPEAELARPTFLRRKREQGKKDS
jgi:Ca-activated chloride channel family protein